MALSQEILTQYNTAGTVLLPKGENRGAVSELLTAAGLEVPAFGGRSLHSL